MIIVSQDRKQFVNFERVTNFWIDDNEIYADGELLGNYKTKERAIEVLQEMIKAYTCWENFKYGIAEGIGTPKYEMPGE